MLGYEDICVLGYEVCWGMRTYVCWGYEGHISTCVFFTEIPDLLWGTLHIDMEQLGVMGG